MTLNWILAKIVKLIKTYYRWTYPKLSYDKLSSTFLGMWLVDATQFLLSYNLS
jgi:hypothetical protein